MMPYLLGLLSQKHVPTPRNALEMLENVTKTDDSIQLEA